MLGDQACHKIMEFLEFLELQKECFPVGHPFPVGEKWNKYYSAIL